MNSEREYFPVKLKNFHVHILTNLFHKKNYFTFYLFNAFFSTQLTHKFSKSDEERVGLTETVVNSEDGS